MADVIWGLVTNVIDGDTFEMNVTHIGKSNSNKYNENEIVRINGIDAPEMGTPEGLTAKMALSLRILGKQVVCTVHARDKFGRVVADFEIES